ncbi:MAG: hypothetical protein KDA93_18435 [Planctomycetaceae bacterium]|nr:hypothetical protein [Planctomycetaceae bacterium]
MRAFVASTFLIVGLVIVSSSAKAGEPTLSSPIPSTTDSYPDSSFETPPPVSQDFDPAIPQVIPSYESTPSMKYAAPSTSPAYKEMPRPSYEDVASGYLPPSHSLVPSALSAGPRFVGLGNYGGAYAGGTHIRYPYYNYRSPWTYGGPASINHTIVW